ncbi:MAG TPA: hypothetical protein VJP86_06545 [Vicinamibacterales bacterium]|nr:hypothetical protein [Vicinamibacterales bacterium]
MRTSIRSLALIAGFAGVSLIAAAPARAGCLVIDGEGMPVSLIRTAPMAFQTPGGFAHPGEFEQNSIVGLWQVHFVSTITTDLPDGSQIKPGDTVDAGYVTWHDDGTEIMNSGRPPMTGSFCMGVYKKTSKSGYKLNHVALSWDPSGQHLIGPASIKEEVSVNRSGDQYEGRFTIDQFDTEQHLLLHFEGQVTGRRIGVD